MFDAGYLTAIGGENKKFIHDVIKIFLEESAKTLQQLQLNIEQYQPQDIKQTAHKLKSSLHAIGEKNVAQIAETIEKASIEKDEAYIVEQFTYLKAGYEELKENIKEFLTENPY